MYITIIGFFKFNYLSLFMHHVLLFKSDIFLLSDNSMSRKTNCHSLWNPTKYKVITNKKYIRKSKSN